MDFLSDEERKTLTRSVDYQRGYSRRAFATVNDQEEQQQQKQQKQPATRGTTKVAAAKSRQDLKNQYDALQDSTREEVTLESFIHTFSDKDYTEMLSMSNSEVKDIMVKMLVQADQKQAKADQKIVKMLVQADQKLAEADQKLARLIAEKMLTKLPESPVEPEVIDGALVAYLSYPPITRKRTRDQWGYAEVDNQSYNTVSPSAQYSSMTVEGVLNGDNVHFNMFEEGKTKVECIRFGFVGNPLETVDPSTVVEDPTEINANVFKNLFQNLESPDGLKDKLQSHAKRLEIIQHALYKLGSTNESLAQALFQHFLGELIADLDEEDGADEKNRVVNVDSYSADMTVKVQVCRRYILAQKKPG